MKILIINGPNLNTLGQREPHIYGNVSLADVQARLETVARELGDIELEFFQSNHEGAILDCIHQNHGRGLAGAIINPGGLSHTSVSLHDAIKAVDYPFAEVHVSNIFRREPWRQRSITSQATEGTITGLGWRGYELALRYFVSRAKEGK